MNFKSLFKGELTEGLFEGDYIKGYSSKMVAKDEYKKLLDEVKDRLKRFEKKISKHSASFKKSGEQDWGYVGDIEYANNRIKELETMFN